MGVVTKINFPYFLETDYKSMPVADRLVVFFGTDFHNLPLGSNHQTFINKTNAMLAYIEKNFSGRCLLYQPHPNEKDESDHLDLGNFTVGERTVAELFLYDNAGKIEYVFSACSGASISAYAMGFDSAIFLDTLHTALSEETITGYRSYFAGLPDLFFIKSFDATLPRREPVSKEAEKLAMEKIRFAVGEVKKVWVLAADPALALRGAIVVGQLRQERPELKTCLLMINHRRWELIKAYKDLFSVFDELIELPNKRIWYSVRPKKVLAAWRVARDLRKLPIFSTDAIISLSHLLFEENCLLSYYPKTKKLLLIENRWHHFIYEENGLTLPAKEFHKPWGVRIFNYFVEPLLGLHRTIFREYKDGKVINFFRYKKPLERIYNQTFVLMPGSFDGSVASETAFQPALSTWSKFFKRLIISRFGLEKLKRVTLGKWKRRRIIKVIKHGAKLTSRRELQTLLGAPGLINDDEVPELQRYAGYAAANIVEIGPAYGGSSLLFLLGKRSGVKVYSIDPFVPDSKGDFQATRDLCYKKVSRALVALDESERVAEWTILSDYSFNVVKSWQESIDLLFIDGDHNYEAVKKDFEDWFPLVKKNGFIIFHDSCRVDGTPEEICNRGWPGPTKLAQELMNDPNLEIVERVYSLNIFRKKGHD